MSSELFDTVISISIVVNGKTTTEIKALLVELQTAIQALKDTDKINYADYSVSRTVEKMEGRIG